MSPAQRDSYLGDTTSEPKRPWPSSKGPAVKKRVFVGPLFGAPLPKAIAQRPSMAIGGPSAEWSGPRCWNSPCPLSFAGSQAWMRPLPKLPTSRSPLKKPKSLGARASPHGELSWPLDATRRSRSEEHTSELQSPCNLVCRLLLEKKKTHVTTDDPG